MKKRKIIFIYSRGYNNRFYSPDTDFYYLAGWTATIAAYILKYTDMYEVENWRAEKDVREVVTREIDPEAIDSNFHDDNPASKKKVICKLFPAVLFRGSPYSFALNSELKKEAKKNEIIIHNTQAHSFEMLWRSHRLRSVPFIVQHQGSPSPENMMIIKGKDDLTKKIFYYLKWQIEKVSMKNIDYYLPCSVGEMKYASKIMDPGRIIFYHRGVDFNNIFVMSKAEARKKLNIPNNKKVMVYVGQLYDLKGVHLILKTFKELKTKYDVILLLVGGRKTDPLYDEAVKSGAQIVLYWVPRDIEMPLYLNAADVYLMPSWDEGIVQWAGVGMAPLEALACNTPVVAPSLVNYMHEPDIERIGLIPEDENDITRCVSRIFDNSASYQNTRETVRKYYDRKVTISKLINLYEELFEKYYGSRTDQLDKDPEKNNDELDDKNS